MFDEIDFTKFVVTPLTDLEFAELSNDCDRKIPDSVRQLIQTIGFPQNVCYSLPEGEDQFLSNQEGIPTDYCIFGRDDDDDSLFAIGPNDSLFRVNSYGRGIDKQPQTLKSWLLERLNKPSEEASPLWKTQLSFTTNNEEVVVELLSKAFQLTDVANWEFEDKSPAEVITHHLSCMTPEGPSYISRQEYHGWTTPIFYFDRDISATGIREAKAAFRTFQKADVGFKLINYGVF